MLLVGQRGLERRGRIATSWFGIASPRRLHVGLHVDEIILKLALEFL